MVIPIFETRIRHISAISPSAREKVIKTVESMRSDKPFSDYVKIIYQKQSPPSIISIEPIMGNIFEVM